MKMICDCDNEDEMADVQVSLEHTVIIVIVIIVHTILTYQAWLVTARCAGDCRATSLRLRLASGQVGPAGSDHDDHDAGSDHDDHGDIASEGGGGIDIYHACVFHGLSP